MSHHQGVPGAAPPRNPHERPLPKAKRLRTKRERNAAKFGPKLPLGVSRWGPYAPHHRLHRPLWGGLPLGSPLGPPKAVVITKNRLCHRGLFNREVKSLDVRRLLTPGPSRDGAPPPAPLPAPQIEEREPGGVPAGVLKELVGSLASLLGGFGAFLGRELVAERRHSLVAALRRHCRTPLDLGVFLAHRTPAQPSAGQGTPPWEARPGPPGRVMDLRRWEVRDPPIRTPSPLRAVNRPPCAPSPIFRAPGEQETPFSWSSAKDEEDETPEGLRRTSVGPAGLLPGPPPFWGSPQPPQEEEEEREGDEGWTPIAPPAFSPDPPPWGPLPRAPRGCSQAPRPPRTPQIWRLETPWNPPEPSRAPWDPRRPPWDSPGPPQIPPSSLWEPPDPTRASPDPSRPPRTPELWNPEPPRVLLDPPRPLWGSTVSPRPPWDPKPWSPDPARAAPDPHRPPWSPRLWNLEPPRASPNAPRPLWHPPRSLWDSPDPPRAPPDPPRSPLVPQLWSPQPPWDHAVLPRSLWDPPGPPRDPHRAPRDPRLCSLEPAGAPPEPSVSRCCCRQLCRDMAQRDALRHELLCRDIVRRDPACHDTFRRAPPRPAPLCRDMPCRDPPQCCHRPPKRRCRDWGGVRGGAGTAPPAHAPVGLRVPLQGRVCWTGALR